MSTRTDRISGLPRAYENPSLTVAASARMGRCVACPVADVTRGACVSAQAAAKNVSASRANTGTDENALTSTPPMTGPRNSPVCSPTATSAFARGSSSLETRDGRMLPLAGQKNESAMPKAAAMEKQAQICTAWADTSTHSAETSAPLTRCEQIMTCRGDHLSVIAPPTSIRTPLQPTLQSMTSARVAAEWLMERTSQAKATWYA